MAMDMRGELPAAQGLPFRPDIQGLRALAIVAVVACHAGVPGFAGGFVGVDLFFVISGYLISGLLLQELQQQGRVDLVAFYARRCKRLLPALLLVTAVTLGAVRVLLEPFGQWQQLRAAWFVPLWLGNVHFSLVDTDYFAAGNGANVFLHTWSLAVEEQFYLLWPFLTAGLLLDRTAPAGNNPRRLWQGLSLVLLVSLGACVVLSLHAPRLAFYMMPTRAWEFALGALVFLALRQQDTASCPRSLARLRPCGTLFAWCGLALVLMAVLLLHEALVYPGFLALLPAAGAALLLYGGGLGGSGLLSRLLACGPLQWLGNVSYAWYLWHWPVLVLGTEVLAPLGNARVVQAVLVALSLLLAALTHVTVEQPLRHARVAGRRPGTVLAGSLLLMLVMAGGVQELQQRAGSDAAEDGLGDYRQAAQDLPPIYRMGCDQWHESAAVLPCSFGGSGADSTAVLIGDSIGAQWFSALARPLADAGWRFIVYTKSACPIVDEPFFYARIGMLYGNCALWRERMLAEVAALEPELVFIGSDASYPFDTAQWREGTMRVLQTLAPRADEVFLLQGTLALPFDGPACLARRAGRPAFLAASASCSAAAEQQPFDRTAADGLQAAAAAWDNVHLVDLNPLVCAGAVCSAERDGVVIFRDGQHLTDRFVASLAPALFERLRLLSGRDGIPWP